jgi:hypothetical protein
MYPGINENWISKSPDFEIAGKIRLRLSTLMELIMDTPIQTLSRIKHNEGERFVLV